MKQAICTQCGGKIEVDELKDAWVCPYCGSAFIVEKAINKFETINNVTHVVNKTIYGNEKDDAEDWEKRAKCFLEIGNFQSALTAYNEAAMMKPWEVSYWWGGYLAQTENFKIIPYDNTYLKNIVKLVSHDKPKRVEARESMRDYYELIKNFVKVFKVEIEPDLELTASDKVRFESALAQIPQLDEKVRSLRVQFASAHYFKKRKLKSDIDDVLLALKNCFFSIQYLQIPDVRAYIRNRSEFEVMKSAMLQKERDGIEANEKLLQKQAIDVRRALTERDTYSLWDRGRMFYRFVAEKRLLDKIWLD